MDIRTIVILLVEVSLALIVCSVGLQARWSDLFTALRRPGALLRAFLAVNVIVPLAAAATAMMLPIEPVLRVGLVAMAIAPISPSVAGNLHKPGVDPSQALAVYAALLLLSTAAVPATLALLRLLGTSATIVPTGEIVRLAILSGLVPLFAGLALASFWPDHARRLAPIAALTGNLMLVPAMPAIAWHFRSEILALLGSGLPAAILVTMSAGLAAGHWLGGPSPAGRNALAIAAISRHPGIAALIIRANFDDGRAMLVVVLFMLFGVIGCAAYAGLTREARRLPSPHPAE
jgi:BASS family bile acid:Na+ symporter